MITKQLHESIRYKSFEILTSIQNEMKHDTLYETLQIHQAYSSQDQEYEKNEFYGDSYLEERISSLVLQLLRKYEDIPIEIYSSLRIHSVKNQTLGEIFDALHLGDSKIFEKKNKGDLVESLIGGCVLISQQKDGNKLFLLYALALIDFIFYHSCYIFFNSNHLKNMKEIVLNDITIWFKDQLKYYSDLLQIYLHHPDKFTIEEQFISVDLFTQKDHNEIGDGNDIDSLLESTLPLDFGIECSSSEEDDD